MILDNRAWLTQYSMLGFLRDIGKHFTIPYMLSKESVQQRLQSGLTYTEFSYMTLQAADFLHLFREHGVELQLGGGDQWGNITAGLELIRRAESREEGAEPPAFGLCSPLLLTRAGVKMGKSEKGAVYLDPALTTPFDFYQYWLNDEDELAVQHLKWLTLLPRERIDQIAAEQAAAPQERAAQKALAHDLTARIHGTEEAERQVRVAAAAFSGEPITDPDVLEVLYGNVDSFEFGDEELGGDALSLSVASGLYPSRSEARRAIAQGNLSVNGEKVTESAVKVPAPIDGRYLVLRSGKRKLYLGRRRQD